MSNPRPRTDRAATWTPRANPHHNTGEKLKGASAP